jgi:hypothetical protein
VFLLPLVQVWRELPLLEAAVAAVLVEAEAADIVVAEVMQPAMKVRIYLMVAADSTGIRANL